MCNVPHFTSYLYYVVCSFGRLVGRSLCFRRISLHLSLSLSLHVISAMPRLIIVEPLWLSLCKCERKQSDYITSQRKWHSRRCARCSGTNAKMPQIETSDKLRSAIYVCFSAAISPVAHRTNHVRFSLFSFFSVRLVRR